MKAVLDTNIFISGIHWTGASGKVLYAWRSKRFELISSIPIIEEIIKILANFKIPLAIEDIKEWEQIILKNSILVEPFEKLNAVKEDPSDDKFLEAGIAGNAEYIVTQDKHLLGLKEFQGVKIVKPERFLEIIN